MKVSSFIVVIIFSIYNFSSAQTGSWNPANADLSFPRTLLKSSQIATIQSTLANTGIFDLFSGVYSSANSNIPTDNTSSSSRLERAHIAKNSAFVVLMGKKLSNGNVVTLPGNESDSLKNKVIYLLENLNSTVDTYPANYDNWQWRTKELIDYVCAYDLLKGAGLSDAILSDAKLKLQQFAGNLYKESNRSILGLNFFDLVKNNHALMTASALGISAVVINDVTSADANYQPLNWINCAMWNIDNDLWYDVERLSDTSSIYGYAESPHYFRYAFLNCLPFFRAMGNFLPNSSAVYTYRGNSRTIRNPFYDETYDLLYQWITLIRMPDGRYPAIDDSFINEALPELALTGKSKFNWQLNLSRLTSNNTLSGQLLSSSTDMRANYICANVPMGITNENLFQALPQSGNLVFRSSWDTTAVYMHVLAENGIAKGTGGHNHADVTSFIIHAYGQLLALDPGYVRYTRRDEVGNATNHNMILVDGQGPPMGTPGNPGDADGFIENTFDTKLLDYGEIRTNYLESDITRKALFIRDKYFILGDFIKSNSPHHYQWQLHGYGLEGGSTEGTFTDNFVNHEGLWKKGGVSLLAHVTASGGANFYNKVTNKHEYGYDSVEFHTTMIVNKNSTTNSQFLSVLYPYISNPPSISTLTSPSFTALKIVDGSFKEVALSKSDTTTQTLPASITNLGNDISTDATLSFFSLEGSNIISQFLVDSCSKFTFGSTNLFSASPRMDAAFQRLDSANYQGYAGSSGTISFYIERAPVGFVGAGVTSYQYNTTEKKLTLILNSPSYFALNTYGPVSVDDEKLKPNKFKLLQNYPNPFNSKTVISWQSPVDGHQSLKIYDLLGREVSSLVNEYKPAGQHSVEWDANNLPSGIYICKLSIGLFSEMKKMVLIK